MDFRLHRTLGRTGLKVSRLGVGASYGVPPEALERAYHEGGVNFFYWGAIRRKGMMEGLRRLVRTERDRIVIALQTYDHVGYFMGAFLNRGLSLLRIDYADLLILGGYNRIPRERVIDAAVGLRDQGKVRFIALSGHNRSLFGELAGETGLPIDAYMIRYNAAHRGAEQDVFPHLPGEKRPGIMVFTATRWGHLLKEKKMPPGERPLTSAECYRFALSNRNVDACLIGPRNGREMKEALLALEGGPMSEEEMMRARRIGDYVYGGGKS